MSPNKITVRAYHPDDIFYVVGVAKRFQEGRGYTFNEGSFCTYLNTMFEIGIILIMEDDGDVIGVCACKELINYFTGLLTMHRADIWIEPEYRGQGLTNLFYERLKEIGAALEVKEYSWEIKR